MGRMEQSARVSLKDVAQRAGVSIGTASNVFSGKVWVAPETRSHVLATATELGYVPRTRQDQESPVEKATTLGFMVRSTPVPLASNPYYGPVLSGVEKVCSAQGMSLMYAVAEEHIHETHELPVMIQQRKIQGLLVVDYFNPAFFNTLQEFGIPFVLLEHELATYDVDTVIIDDEHGGYLATRYLLQMGHVSPPPALIAGDTNLVSIAHRLQGYQRALAEHHLVPLQAYMRYGDLNVGGGYREMLALLDLPTPPSAVFCCNDLSAIGALNALKERNVQVPEQCSVIGYDDIEIAGQLSPPLTTIRSETELLGMQGVWHLLERLNFPDLAARHTRLRVKLVERRSVKEKKM